MVKVREQNDLLKEEQTKTAKKKTTLLKPIFSIIFRAIIFKIFHPNL